MVVLQEIIDFLFPKRCLFCKIFTTKEEGLVCKKCVLKLPLIRSPFCKRCGQPLPKALFKKTFKNPKICPACRTRRLPFSVSRSVMAYDEDTSRLILRLKYGDQTYLAPIFADLSFLFQRDLFEGVDFIVPIPISKKRLLKRKYNQAALIGSALGKRLKIPMNTRAFTRIHFRGSQGGLSFQKRRENVKDAFSVKYPADLKGKTILLVDDVMASGATLLSASRILKKADVKEIRVLTIARTI